jgi:hypothetical protein
LVRGRPRYAIAPGLRRDGAGAGNGSAVRTRFLTDRFAAYKARRQPRAVRCAAPARVRQCSPERGKERPHGPPFLVTVVPVVERKALDHLKAAEVGFGGLGGAEAGYGRCSCVGHCDHQ